jgi:uncharacterized membrane protein
MRRQKNIVVQVMGDFIRKLLREITSKETWKVVYDLMAYHEPDEGIKEVTKENIIPFIIMVIIAVLGCIILYALLSGVRIAYGLCFTAFGIYGITVCIRKFKSEKENVGKWIIFKRIIFFIISIVALLGGLEIIINIITNYLK